MELFQFQYISSIKKRTRYKLPSFFFCKWNKVCIVNKLFFRINQSKVFPFQKIVAPPRSLIVDNFILKVNFIQTHKKWWVKFAQKKRTNYGFSFCFD